MSEIDLKTMSIREGEVLPVGHEHDFGSESYQLDLLKRPDFVVEANFMNIPIFNFDRNGKSGRSDVSIHQFIEKVDEFSTIIRKVVVTVAKKEEKGKGKADHLPNAFDHDVWLVLMDLWDEQGRQDSGKVFFRIIDICKRLQLHSDSGKNYKRIQESISRLARTQIDSKNAFYSIESAKTGSRIIPLMQDSFLQVAAGRGRKQSDFCYIVISEPILDNLRGNFTARISRKLYQQLDLGYSKRISNLITYRKQKKDEYGAFDFDVSQLAQLLPMSGAKLFTSKVMERLQPSLKELKAKKLFSHELIRTPDGHHVIRFIPLSGEDELVGPDSLRRFKAMASEIYGRNHLASLGMTDEDFHLLLSKHKRVIVSNGRKYSWVYHAISTLLFQLRFTNYKVEKPNSVAHVMIEKEKLDRPQGFKPLDIAYEELAREREAQEQARSRENERVEAEDTIDRIAQSYANKLKPAARKRYLALIRKEHDYAAKCADESSVMKGLLITMIKQEMLHGEKIDIEDVPESLATTRSALIGPEGNA